MPETRGVQASEEVKAEWSTAYKYYLRAPGDRFDKKKDRTAAHRLRSPGNEADPQTSQTTHSKLRSVAAKY